MEQWFARRMASTPKSFVREILKVTEDAAIISFAGGLPNPASFPVRAVAEAAAYVLRAHGQQALQYRSTEGYRPLREYIARRYQQRFGMQVEAEQILITNGSQQAQDLVGKVFIDAGDRVVLERPSYLGAIQAFSLYEPRFVDVPLQDDGIDLPQLECALTEAPAKLLYAVPNFQNPSGISYSLETRHEVAELLRRSPTVLIEDDPYGELCFEGTPLPPVACLLPERTVLLGSFSKIVSPGMRLGWLCAPRSMIEPFTIAKQASDLHSNAFCQYIVHRYLAENDIDEHIGTIRAMYRRQRDIMLEMIGRYCPPEVRCTRPQGGMFIWMTLPEGMSSMRLFDHAIAQGVAFVPGQPFFVDGGGDQSLRLNFTNTGPEEMEEGVKRLARAIDNARRDG